jgi:3-oxoacyl-[acyl-carrier-protein] synthase III
MSMQARIIATGAAVPDRVVDNEEMSRLTGLSGGAILRRTGIKKRRWVEPGESTADLAMRASVVALERAGERAESLDAIILSTTSPDTPLPSSACHVQRLLGATRAFAFDLSASCSGFLYALSVGDQLIRANRAQRVLVIAAEVKSRFLNCKDASTAILFGDGGAAVILAPSHDEHGICSVTLHSDGNYADLIGIKAGGSRLPCSEKTLTEGLHALTMQGPRLFRRAICRLEIAVMDTLKAHGLGVGEVRWFLFHQANGRLLEKVAERLGIPPSQTLSTIERYGNASSSSLPITLDAVVEAGQIKPGDLILLATIGSGLTWGTALLRW